MKRKHCEFSGITIDHVKSWEYKTKSPAGRGVYYSDKLDAVGYVSHGRGKVYFNRKEGYDHTNYAIAFEDYIVI